MTTSCPNPLWRTDPVQVFVIAMLDSANYWWLLSLLRCGVQMLVVYLPWLQQVFQTEALSPNDLAFIVFVASSMVALDTARKLLFPDRQGETSVSVTSFTVATPGLDGTSIGLSRSRPSAIVKCLCPAEFCFLLSTAERCTLLSGCSFPFFGSSVQRVPKATPRMPNTR